MLACWCIVFEQGTGLDVFDAERVPGLQVLIGNVSCVITAIQSSYLSVIAPAEPSVINEDGNAIVIVRHCFCGMLVSTIIYIVNLIFLTA